MPLRERAPKHLDVPPPETALFQHSPAAFTPLKVEWEPGCQPDEVYDRVLPPWRSKLRRYFVRRLQVEKDWMSKWQAQVRNERRDKYFYWTALFGTHYFFMTFLPMFWFFGHPRKGRGMIMVVGLGIYISSFAKDLVCTPRPYSPPVIRLSMSTHGQEYGFPSSHSTNSVSIALFLGGWLWDLRESCGMNVVIAGETLLGIYAASVVGGRLYTGMHSVADIIGGSLMGLGCNIFWLLIRNPFEQWLLSRSLTFPLMFTPIILSMIHFHPEPVDPCPCFEDAIAILAVILGIELATWYDKAKPIYPAIPHMTNIWNHGPFWAMGMIFWRVVFGISIIVIWRLVAKTTLLKVLPPVFRLFAGAFELPTRKGYQPATSYEQVPTPFRPIPSFLDLPTADAETPSDITSSDVTPEEAFKPSSRGSHSPITPPFPQVQRNPLPSRGSDLWKKREKKKKQNPKAPDEPKYDVEVLTKVGVYSGIGVLATHLIPMMFEMIESRFLA